MITYNLFEQRFLQQMNNHRLWSHPFFQIVETADISVLQQWAIQAGRIDQAFANILQNMSENNSIRARHEIEQNLNDELGNGDSSMEHFTLFRHALAAINVTEQEYESTPWLLPTRVICDILLLAASSNNPRMSLGLMASEELICPREFPIFYEAFLRYGERNQLQYFPIHISADVGHSQDLIRLCYEHCQNDQQIEEILHFQNLDLELNTFFYDALYNKIKNNI